jgi:tetratricopeptide (TPR) repeat protein
MRKETPEVNFFRESTLNGLGYEFLFRGDQKMAIEIFKLNVDAYPKSANAYDSLSEAYEGQGNTEMAKELAQKALELLPKDSSVDERRREAIKRSAEERLRRLKGDGTS